MEVLTMKFVKKIFALLLTIIMVAGVFSGVQVDAKPISIATPKVTVKTFSKKTGVKIIIGKTKDADGYEVSISGTPANYMYCSYFKYDEIKDEQRLYMVDHFDTVIERNGNAKRILVYRKLQPGTYTVKIRSWNNNKYGSKIYSEWQTKSFVLQEAKTNGYASSYDFTKVKQGDIIKFGAYEQDLNYTNGKEAIEWIVLKKTNNSVFLLSKYALDALPYHNTVENVTWETCSLRKWLNNDFIKSAFNKTEQSMIKTTLVENYDNVKYKTSAGNDTKDKVFLLSMLETIDSSLGFKDSYDDEDMLRVCALAWNKNKKSPYDTVTSNGETSCNWWLRTPGIAGYYTMFISYSSGVERGYAVGDFNSTYRDTNENGTLGGYSLTGRDTLYAGVRPAMWIKLKS